MRADRLLSLLMFLQVRGRMTAQELARELEVSERTIHRDVEALNTAGVPVIAERGPGGGCYLPGKYRTNLTGLNEMEVRALFLSTVAGPLSDLGLGKAMEAAVLKLSAALPEAHRQNVERVRRCIHVDTAQWFRSSEPVPYLGAMQEAVWQDLRVRMSYRRGDESRVRRFIEPYGLVAKANIWYMVAAMAGPRLPYGVTNVQTARRYVQVYRISRVLSAELTDERFARPHDFDLQAYWAEWCRDFEGSLPKYQVRLKITPALIPVLPNIYGEGVRALIDEADPPDGEGNITLELTFEGFEHALSSVLGLGTRAEVLEPAELRESLAEMASNVAAFYRGRSG